MVTPSASMPDPWTETRLFGVRLHAATLAEAVQRLIQRAHSRQGGWVCVANVDMLTRARRDERLTHAMEGALAVVTDGMPLVWALTRLQGLRAERLNGLRLTQALCTAAAQAQVSVYLYGGTPTEVATMARALQAHAPGLRIAGQESPPLLPTDPPRDDGVLARIRDSGAGLVLVGLGCPKQELWMQTHAPHLPAVCLGVGYVFALLGGTHTEAPRWMQGHGLEWLYRLAQDPRRLWRRYAVGNSRFIGLVLRAWWRGRSDTP